MHILDSNGIKSFVCCVFCIKYGHQIDVHMAVNGKTYYTNKNHTSYLLNIKLISIGFGISIYQKYFIRLKLQIVFYKSLNI